MANIRDLKKAIDLQVYEVISDCFTWKEMNHEDKKIKDVDSIVEDAVNLRNDLIARINTRVISGDQKEVKAHYKLIASDLASGTDALFGRLSSATLKKKK